MSKFNWRALFVDQVKVVDMVDAIEGICQVSINGMIKEIKRELNGNAAMYYDDYSDNSPYVLDVIVAGGAVANLIKNKCLINDIDMYVVVDSARSGWPRNYMATHPAGKYIQKFQDADYDGVKYWSENIKDKTYKVRRCYRRGIFNIIEVVCRDNHIPSALGLVKSFDLSCCQAGFKMNDKFVSETNSFKYYHSITIEAYHTPIQSVFRALNKAEDLEMKFELLFHMPTVYKMYRHHSFDTRQVFALKKYVDSYYRHEDLLKEYFTLGYDAEIRCYYPVWNADFEASMIREIVQDQCLLVSKDMANRRSHRDTETPQVEEVIHMVNATDTYRGSSVNISFESNRVDASYCDLLDSDPF